MKTIRFYQLIYILLFLSGASFSTAQVPLEIYTMKGCSRCAYSIDYVKKNNIKYVEYSTENDKYNSKMWELVQNSKEFKGGSITMPVIVRGGTAYFNIDDLQKFMASVGDNTNSNNNNNNNSNNNNKQNISKKTGCISGNCDDGKGVYVFDNNDKYDGNFVNSFFSGKGKYTWENGSAYDGDWENGVQEGYGTYTDENGEIQKGNWLDGELQQEEEQGDNNLVNNVSNNSNTNNSNGQNQNLNNAQIQEFIKVHNRYRAEVNVGPLKWSNELAAYAQAWGDHLASIGCKMEHRPKSGQWAQQHGENLYWCSGYAATPEGAVNSWGEEKSDYDGGVMNNSNFAAGHYTQMIWAQTTEVGCAIVKCSNGSYLVVCNYNPPGNYWGESPFKK